MPAMRGGSSTTIPLESIIQTICDAAWMKSHRELGSAGVLPPPACAR